MKFCITIGLVCIAFQFLIGRIAILNSLVMLGYRALVSIPYR